MVPTPPLRAGQTAQFFAMRGNKSSRRQLAEGLSRKHMMSKLVVLIVEDEPLLRMDAVDFIEEAGFEVVEAAHAEEAIAILKARHDIAVVFTDIEMPGSMDGMKLAHAVRLGWPPILIVVASGRVMPHEGELPENVQYIRKPYRAAEVIAAFRPAA